MRLPDAYTWRARTLPVIITCLPAVVLLGTALAWRSPVGIATGAIVTVLSAVASQLGRDRGRALQPELWRSWGGAPTLQLMRHRGSRHPDRVIRLHREAEEVFHDPMPSRADEDGDPEAADARYEDVLAKLRERTRPRDRFPLVFEENANYGFRRNLLGLRAWGIGLALLTLLVAVALLLFASGPFSHRAARWSLPAVASLLLALFWWTAVTPAWVRIPADAYAERLLESIETLRQPAPSN